MKLHRRIAIFTDKYPLLGPIIWVLCVQYFAVQIEVASAWQTPFSLTKNVISDLANTACGPYADRFVCSPQHALMNASFLMLGFTMAMGSLLIYQEFQRSRGTLIGFSLMAISGLGTLLVGFFPENTISALHGLGAFLTFFLGNLSLVILALALKTERPIFRAYTFISGAVSLVALGLFLLHIYLGLGPGGMERVVSYPQTIWLTLFGLYMTATRLRARYTKQQRR